MWREREPLFWHQGGGGDCHLQQEKVARLALAFLPRRAEGQGEHQGKISLLLPPWRGKEGA